MSDTTTPPNRRKRWWLAGLLNLLGGLGVGYLYVGRPVRFFVAAAGTFITAFLLWHGLGGWLARPWIAIVLLLIWFAVFLFFVIDAALIARRTEQFATRWYNRWWLYSAVVVAGWAAMSLVDVRRSVRSFVIPSASMEPTLHVGDRFIVDMRTYDGREPERGDLIVFKLPRDPAIFYVKRIVGLPGDEVQIRDGVLYIDGEPVPTFDAGTYSDAGDGGRNVPMKREMLAKDHAVVVLGYRSNAIISSLYNTASFKVPPASYFVLGDNRENSIDSREQSPRIGVGFVPRANVLGKLAWTYWSSDRSRIGRKLD